MVVRVVRDRFFITCAIAGSLTLTGCAPMPVKDITADKTGYLTSTFTVATLPGKVSERLSKEGKKFTLGFRKMTVDVTSDTEATDGKVITRSAVITLLNAGGPYVQEMIEWSNNGISYAIDYRLTYAGVVQLKYQDVPLTASVARTVYEMKELKQLSGEIAKPTESTSYLFEYALAPSVQLVNFNFATLKCQTEKFYPAKSVHPAFAGMALDVNCERLTNNVVSWKGKYVFLQQYGVGLFVEGTNSGAKTVRKIAKVEIS